MRRWSVWVLAAMASGLASAAAAAPDPCAHPPAAVQGMLKDGWRLLTLVDLEPDDRALWAATHAPACPGFAVARMDGGGAPAYAVALLRARGGRVEETVRLRLPGFAVDRVLMAPAIDSRIVVWRAGPGPTRAWDGGPTVRVAHDSVIVELMEASATQYFLSRGRLRSIQTSD